MIYDAEIQQLSNGRWQCRVEERGTETLVLVFRADDLWEVTEQIKKAIQAEVPRENEG